MRINSSVTKACRLDARLFYNIYHYARNIIKWRIKSIIAAPAAVPRDRVVCKRDCVVFRATTHLAAARWNGNRWSSSTTSTVLAAAATVYTSKPVHFLVGTWDVSLTRRDSRPGKSPSPPNSLMYRANERSRYARSFTTVSARNAFRPTFNFTRKAVVRNRTKLFERCLRHYTTLRHSVSILGGGNEKYRSNQQRVCGRDIFCSPTLALSKLYKLSPPPGGISPSRVIHAINDDRRWFRCSLRPSSRACASRTCAEEDRAIHYILQRDIHVYIGKNIGVKTGRGKLNVEE